MKPKKQTRWNQCCKALNSLIGGIFGGLGTGGGAFYFSTIVGNFAFTDYTFLSPTLFNIVSWAVSLAGFAYGVYAISSHIKIGLDNRDQIGMLTARNDRQITDMNHTLAARETVLKNILKELETNQKQNAALIHYVAEAHKTIVSLSQKANVRDEEMREYRLAWNQLERAMQIDENRKLDPKRALKYLERTRSKGIRPSANENLEFLLAELTEDVEIDIERKSAGPGDGSPKGGVRLDVIRPSTLRRIDSTEGPLSPLNRVDDAKSAATAPSVGQFGSHNPKRSARRKPSQRAAGAGVEPLLRSGMAAGQ